MLYGSGFAALGISKLKKSYEYSQDLIQRNAQRLLALVNELLDLSKLDAGSLKTNNQQIELISFIGYLIKPFQILAEQKEIDLLVQKQEESLLFVTDPEKLQQIISNLISNAIKFTPENGKVTIDIRQKEKELHLVVEDTGIGITPSDLSAIFDRFYQVEQTKDRLQKGTGIGLALVKELVTLMEGCIFAESELGQGSKFTVELPNSQTTNTPQAIIKQEEQSLPILPHPTISPVIHKDKERPIVLIIEDDADIVIYLKTLLKTQYNIQIAVDGQMGIDQAIEQVPDIIICDVQMPKKDGFEVLEVLKTDERTNHIPIIMLTARTTQKDKLTGLKHGADAYLSKPFDQEELFIRLEKLLALRRLLQERYAALPNSPEVLPEPEPEPPFILKIRHHIEADLTASINVEELAEKMLMTRIQVYRKVKALIGLTPSQLINRVRLEHGAQMLRATSLTISEIAYDVGYTDPKYFSRQFSKLYGESPSSYR